jgi:hypothetical protein
MASRHLIAGEPDAILGRYLADLGTRLHGPWRTRAAILAEIRDGLDEATAEHTARGLGPADAATHAVAQFGSPQVVADAFTGELATAYARRTIAAFILTGPLVGICWLLLLHPQPWPSTPAALIAAIPAIPLIAVAIATALGTFATTGRLMRWLPETTPVRALTATTAVAGLCVLSDLTVLTILAIGDHAPSRYALSALAVGASLARIACSITVIRRVIHLHGLGRSRAQV